MSGCPRDVKDACYKTLVRPILEYSCTVWDPHTSKNVNNLEMVQRRSARFVYSNYCRTASPSDMIKPLGWESLAERRKKSKIIMMYKIDNNLIDIPKTLFKPVNPHGRRSNMIFHVPYCKSDTFRFSFIPSATNIWNSLPENIRNQNSLDSLKGHCIR